MAEHDVTPSDEAASEAAQVAATVRAWLDEARDLQRVDPATAKDRIIEARLLARSKSFDQGEAEALYRLAVLTLFDGDPGEAYFLSVQALELAKACDAADTEAAAHLLNAMILQNAGNFAAALESGHAALDAERRIGPEDARTLNLVAAVYFRIGDYDRALGAYDRALAGCDDDVDSKVCILGNLAEVRRVRGEHLLAVSLASQAVSLSREHRSQFLGHGLRELGEVYLALGDVERGEAFLEEALEATLTDDPAVATTAEVRCGVLRARAEFNAGRGRHEAAVRDLQAALDIAVPARLRAEELEVHTSLAASYKALGRFEAALEHQERRFELSQAMFNEGTDLRFRTLQVDREASEAKLQSQLMSERASAVEGILGAGESGSRHVEAFVLDRLAALGEHEGSALHGRAVGTLAAAIAAEMGQAPEDVERLRVAARLHDLGRIGVPDGVLGKPGPLTPDEVRQVRTHTTIGAAVLGSGDSPLMQLAASVALTHHEHWDGSGYPTGLTGDEIPLAGRIVAVADAYATLVTPQTYRPAETSEIAVARIREAAGSHFDPAVVAAFVRVMAASAPVGAVEIEPPAPPDRAAQVARG